MGLVVKAQNDWRDAVGLNCNASQWPHFLVFFTGPPISQTVGRSPISGTLVVRSKAERDLFMQDINFRPKSPLSRSQPGTTNATCSLSLSCNEYRQLPPFLVFGCFISCVLHFYGHLCGVFVGRSHNATVLTSNKNLPRSSCICGFSQEIAGNVLGFDEEIIRRCMFSEYV